MFQLPIPKYEPSDDVHAALAELGGRAERFVEALDLPEGKRFEVLRRLARDALRADGLLGEIDAAVDRLLSPA